MAAGNVAQWVAQLEEQKSTLDYWTNEHEKNYYQAKTLKEKLGKISHIDCAEVFAVLVAIISLALFIIGYLALLNAYHKIDLPWLNSLSNLEMYAMIGAGCMGFSGSITFLTLISCMRRDARKSLKILDNATATITDTEHKLREARESLVVTERELEGLQQSIYEEENLNTLASEQV